MKAAPAVAYRLGRHPRRTDHPALLRPDGTLAHTFAYDAKREEVAACIAHVGLVLHDDDTVTQGSEPAGEGGEIAAALVAAAVLDGAQNPERLGRQLAAVEHGLHAFDQVIYCKGNPTKPSCADSRAILNDRSEALRALISTTPAVTLADAAVLIAECSNLASRLSDTMPTPEDAATYVERLERMLFGALPIVAQAAGLDMDGMGWEGPDRLRVHRYAGVGIQQ